MENLKNLKDWFITLGWSNQVVIIVVFIFFIFGIREIVKKIKKNSNGEDSKREGTSSSTKTKWKLFSWSHLVLVAIAYGIYLIVVNNLPTPEEKIFKELSKNLAEVELQPEKDSLATLNAKVKDGGSLTEEEKRAAMNATKKIGKVRKDYSEGKLVAPTPTVSSAPTPSVVWEWTFEWEATPEQLRRNSNQEKGLINDARVIFCDEKVLKFNYKRPSGKLVELTLSRNDSKDFYQGKVSQSDLYLRVWLVQNNDGNFSGVFDNGPNTEQINIFLKKKL